MIKEAEMEEMNNVEVGLTEEQGQRIVKWVKDHGHTDAEAYHALAYMLNATPEQNKI